MTIHRFTRLIRFNNWS